LYLAEHKMNLMFKWCTCE